MKEKSKKSKKESKIILGIDPGTIIMGYGCIQLSGKEVSLLNYGVIHLKKYETHELKLQHIYNRCLSLIKTYHPAEMALEAPFFGKNVQSMLKLGRAQGVAMAAALHYHIPIFEYAPRRIKQSLTGMGNASKEQVAAMIVNLLKMDEKPKHLDATDGLAAAVCHAFQNDTSTGAGNNKSHNSWESFVSSNKGRIIK